MVWRVSIKVFSSKFTILTPRRLSQISCCFGLRFFAWNMGAIRSARNNEIVYAFTASFHTSSFKNTSFNNLRDSSD